MAFTARDRLLTIAVTATLTSAAWILVGTVLIDGKWSGGRFATQGAQPRTDAPATSAARTPAVSTARRAVAPGGTFIIPVAGIRPGDLTDTFTQSRGGGERLHEAIDIMAPEGTPVIAAADGTVERLFLSERGGKTIYIRSPDRTTIHYYAHLHQYAPGLSEGIKISAGDRLGTVGSTGNAGPSGPHLHYAVMQTTPTAKWWEPATPVNPYPLLRGR